MEKAKGPKRQARKKHACAEAEAEKASTCTELMEDGSKCSEPACGVNPYRSLCKEHRLAKLREGAKIAQQASMEVRLAGIAKRKEQFLQVLFSNAGNIGVSCKNIGIARRTYKEWLAEDPEFEAEVSTVMDNLIDLVESKLMKQIQGDNLTAIIFFLKCQGKARGWVERQEVDLSVIVDRIKGKFRAIIDVVNEAIPDDATRSIVHRRLARVIGAGVS